MKFKKEDVQAIVQRIKEIVGADSDAELARTLGIPRSTVSNWVTRETVPYEICVELVLGRGLRLEWLILGQGSRMGDAADAQRIQQLEAEVAQLKAQTGPAERREPSALGLLRTIIGVADKEGGATEAEMQQRTGASPEEVRSACLSLFRRRVLRQTSTGWALPREALLRFDEASEVASLGEEAINILRSQIIPGAQDTRGALAVADVRIAGQEPGETVMAAIRATLLQLENQGGRRQKVVVGVTPADDDEY